MKTLTALYQEAHNELPAIGSTFEVLIKSGMKPKPLGGGVVDTNPHRLMKRELLQVVDYGVFNQFEPDGFTTGMGMMQTETGRTVMKICAVVQQLEYEEWYVRPFVVDGVLTFPDETPGWAVETYSTGTMKPDFAWYYEDGTLPEIR